jgi:hypothetical protein
MKMVFKMNVIKIKVLLSEILHDFLSIFSNAEMRGRGSLNYSKLVLLLIFSVVYLPHAFILIEDINLISAYEVDPGSMISSLLDLFHGHLYNMLNGYHSKFYGWTFLSINFFALIPVKLFNYFADSQSELLNFLTIKICFFIIGLLSLLALLNILDRLSHKKNYLLSFAVCLLFVFSPTSHLFYFIHPETTGALLIFSAIICLIEYIKSLKRSTFMLGLIFLVGASLSKQTFFIAALPILFCFMHFYRLSLSKSFWEFINSKNFLHFLKTTTLVSLSVAFVIHPYAFIDFKHFLLYQVELSKSFVGAGNVSYLKSLSLWMDIVRVHFVMYLSLLTLPFVIIFSLAKYSKCRTPVFFLAALNGFAAIFSILFVAYGNRIVLSHHYLFPASLFLTLNIFGVIHYLIGSSIVFFSKLSKLAATYLLVISISLLGRESISASYDRFDYKSSIAFKTYNHVKNNIKITDKVAHDHFVAVPFEMNSISCHFWRGCGTDYIEEFNPNYVIFNPNYSFVNPSKEAARLGQYVREHNMVLVATISAKHGNVVDVDINGNNSASVLVYKKP